MTEIQLDDKNFNEEVFNYNGLVVVDFYADWCGPCKMMAPVMEEIAKELEGKPVKICKLNIEEARDVALKYNVMSVPTFVFFKKGAILEELIGAVPKETLVDKIKELIR